MAAVATHVDLSKMVGWATALLPPVTILTALAVWYGQELVLARGRYFGLDPTVLDLSTRDYVFRSANAVLGPLLYLLVASFLLLCAHEAVTWSSEQPSLHTAVLAGGWIAIAFGTVLIIEGIRVVSDRQVMADHKVFRTLVLAAGAVLIAYGARMVRTTPVSADKAMPPLQRGGYVVVAAITLLSLFWASSIAAEQTGTRDSYRLYASGFQDLSRVTIYSPTALALDDAPGVTKSRVREPGSAYRWRYSGLRLFLHSGGKYFLIPVGWASSEHPTFAIHDDSDLRFEFQEPEEL